MQYSDLYWSTSDGLQITARAWSAQEPMAVVLLTHGFGDHSGRFERTARYFSEHRFSVLIPDLRGHGRSDGQRGYIREFDQFLDDLDLGLQQLESRGERLPVFSYGQSFGGLLALYHAMRRKPRLAGLVASSPALKIAMPAPPWKVTVGRTLGKYLPRLSLRAGLDLSELSDDPQTESRARSDRYLHGRITSRTYFGMVDAGQWCLNNPSELIAPTLVMHGSRDTITCAQAARRFAEQAPRCQYQEWPDGKHELHNMADSDQFLRFTVDWMQQQIATGQQVAAQGRPPV